MVTFLYERNIIELDVKQQTIKQSMTFFINLRLNRNDYICSFSELQYTDILCDMSFIIGNHWLLNIDFRFGQYNEMILVL